MDQVVNKVIAQEQMGFFDDLPKQDLSKNPKNSNAESELSPMLRQYVEIKEKHKEHLLLFQVGDFYEVFFDDAQVVADALSIRLTSRDKDKAVPMCGVPIHAVDNYLKDLLRKGFSCVLVSQVEEASATKSMVKREITRIITPGLRYEGEGLEEQSYNFLTSVCFTPSSKSQDFNASLASFDVSTGHCRVQEVYSLDELLESLKRLSPSELILPAAVFGIAVDARNEIFKIIQSVAQELGARVVRRSFGIAKKDSVLKRLESLLGSKNELDKVSNAGEYLFSALECAINYIEELTFSGTFTLGSLIVEDQNNSAFLDSSTRRNLEIFQTRIDGEKTNSLFNRINLTKTSMGSRLFSAWLCAPLTDKSELVKRHDAVQELIEKKSDLEKLKQIFSRVRDIDRITSRISSLRATPKDLALLRDSLAELPELKSIISGFSAQIFEDVCAKFDDLSDIHALLKKSIYDDPPNRFTEGGIFLDSYNSELDNLRTIKNNGQQWLINLEAEQRSKSGISSLRIKYNNVFGYFFEVSKTNLHKVPSYFERKQTLVNAERFVTPELKELEVKLISAKSKQFDLEKNLFLDLRTFVLNEIRRIQRTSSIISEIDIYASLATLSIRNNYTRPEIIDGARTQICEGRHPVVEQLIGQHNFIPNDTFFDSASRRFAILTGPNMGGKSTYLRQVGLIQLLAQIGSFVPAKMAKLALVDRIFTRIGSSDDMSRGDSTFMVEMREVATIIKRATSRSLVLIDEVGRGTATADGLALATAISKWLYENISCRTIFATHFHELTEYVKNFDAMFSLSVGIVEKEKEIIFTHRIEEKAASKSYGIEVARLAGLPETLLEEAEKLLESMTSDSSSISDDFKKAPKKEITEKDNKILTSEKLVIDKIKTINPDALTPYSALQEFYALKAMMGLENDKTGKGNKCS